MSIEINQISKSFNNQLALKNISFKINKGEIVGFLGPNGAGKTTLMRIICGYIKQNIGSIKICSLDKDSNEELVKSKIGYLAENNPLYKNMYIKEYLLFVGKLYNVNNLQNCVLKVMKQTGLLNEKNKKIQQLSKGFKQRVGLAAALIHNPEILILDEPTTGLDPNQLIEIRNLILELAKNKTILFSTHILQEVEKICDRIIIINNGEIIDDQSVSNLTKTKTSIENYFIKKTSI
ncbi:MAG: multidrug ABC transporter ATP-binding protein [Flavobacteriales bacterium]|nr:multidrug ABC transporter ATP-binding protein [Flavobacteriales bacterium]|tara:strand:+ start:207 stop:911 length:705 start_codon:yes stop_codon:yes gene_type:complete